MPYDLSNLSNVSNYLSQQRNSGMYVPSNGSMNMPSRGWDGWNNYNANNTYTANGTTPLPDTINNIQQQGPRNNNGLRKQYQDQYASLFHPLLRNINNYPLLSPERRNYGNYIHNTIRPLMDQYRWDGRGQAPTLPQITAYDPAQTY
jgi:hypothetical protein